MRKRCIQTSTLQMNLRANLIRLYRRSDHNWNSCVCNSKVFWTRNLVKQPCKTIVHSTSKNLRGLNSKLEYHIIIVVLVIQQQSRAIITCIRKILNPLWTHSRFQRIRTVFCLKGLIRSYQTLGLFKRINNEIMEICRRLPQPKESILSNSNGVSKSWRRQEGNNLPLT